MARFVDLTGLRFGRWVVRGCAGTRPGTREYVWACKCDCGFEKILKGSYLRSGKTQGCGCHRQRRSYTRHGLSKSKAYKSYQAMLQRCYSKTAIHFDNYGGRGIEVCERWRQSFTSFLEDMGERPEGMSLDRINVNGDYEPGNCRWADRKTQIRNRRMVCGNDVTALEVFFDEVLDFVASVDESKRDDFAHRFHALIRNGEEAQDVC